MPTYFPNKGFREFEANLDAFGDSGLLEEGVKAQIDEEGLVVWLENARPKTRKKFLKLQAKYMLKAEDKKIYDAAAKSGPAGWVGYAIGTFVVNIVDVMTSMPVKILLLGSIIGLASTCGFKIAKEKQVPNQQIPEVKKITDQKKVPTQDTSREARGE